MQLYRLTCLLFLCLAAACTNKSTPGSPEPRESVCDGAAPMDSGASTVCTKSYGDGGARIDESKLGPECTFDEAGVASYCPQRQGAPYQSCFYFGSSVGAHCCDQGNPCAAITCPPGDACSSTETLVGCVPHPP